MEADTTHVALFILEGWSVGRALFGGGDRRGEDSAVERRDGLSGD